MSKEEQILKRAKELENNPLVTPNFGKNWIDHAMKHYTPRQISEIASNRGKRVIALEAAIKEICDKE